MPSATLFDLLPDFGTRAQRVSPPQATVTIALTPANANAPVGVNTGIRFTTDDAAALHAQLRNDGVDVDELLRWEGIPPMFDFRDPDGNVLYVSEVPRSSGR